MPLTCGICTNARWVSEPNLSVTVFNNQFSRSEGGSPSLQCWQVSILEILSPRPVSSSQCDVTHHGVGKRCTRSAPHEPVQIDSSTLLLLPFDQVIPFLKIDQTDMMEHSPFPKYVQRCSLIFLNNEKTSYRSTHMHKHSTVNEYKMKCLRYAGLEIMRQIYTDVE